MIEKKRQWWSSQQDLLPAFYLGLAWIVTIAAGLTAIVPRSLVALMVVFSICILIIALMRGQKISLIPTGSLCMVLIFWFLAYLFYSALFVSEVGGAYKKIFYLGYLVLVYLLWKQVIKDMTPLQLWRIVRGVILGVMVSALFVIFELYSHFYLTKLFFNDISSLTLTQNRLISLDEAGKIVRLPNLFVNSNVCLLNIVFWPVVLLLLSWNSVWKSQQIRLALMTVFIVMMVFLTLRSQSESAKVALILSLFSFALSSYRPDFFHKLIVTAWSLAVIGVIPAVLLAYQTGIQKSEVLPFSARDRIYIWHYNAVRVPDNLLFGIGVRASRHKMAQYIKSQKGKKYVADKDHPALHSHNLFLQSWYELGLVGALFLLAFGIGILQNIKALPQKLKPFGYATFVSISGIAAFGYGMWQSWLLVSYGWAAIFMALALFYYDDNSKAES